MPSNLVMREYGICLGEGKAILDTIFISEYPRQHLTLIRKLARKLVPYLTYFFQYSFPFNIETFNPSPFLLCLFERKYPAVS